MPRPTRRCAWETRARVATSGTGGEGGTRGTGTGVPPGGGRLEVRPSKNGSSSAMEPSARGGHQPRGQHVVARHLLCQDGALELAQR